jgi:hypothetical protein
MESDLKLFYFSEFRWPGCLGGAALNLEVFGGVAPAKYPMGEEF